MAGTNDIEVAVIQRRHRLYPKPLRQGHDGGVDESQGKIRVLVNEIGGPAKVINRDRLKGQLIWKGAQECRLGRTPKVSLQEVANLRNHRAGNEERSRGTLEVVPASFVVVVIRISGSHQWTAVDKDHAEGKSARRMSSERAPRSCRPLRPIAVKLRRRGSPGRDLASSCASRAAASCSGSFSTRTRSFSLLVITLCSVRRGRIAVVRDLVTAEGAPRFRPWTSPG